MTRCMGALNNATAGSADDNVVTNVVSGSVIAASVNVYANSQIH